MPSFRAFALIFPEFGVFSSQLQECLGLPPPSGLHSDINSLHTLFKVVILSLQCLSSALHCFSPYHLPGTLFLGAFVVQVKKSLVPSPSAYSQGDTMGARSNVLHKKLDTPQVRDQENYNTSLLRKGKEETVLLLGKVMRPNYNFKLGCVNKISLCLCFSSLRMSPSSWASFLLEI